MRWLWGFLRKRPKTMAGFFGSLLVLLIGLWIASPWIVAGLRKANAEDVAVEYAQKLYPDQKAHYATCQGRDTDDNGYVSCTLRIVRPDGTEDRIPLECAAFLVFSYGQTCREMANVRQSR